MITERNTILTSTHLDERLAKETYKSVFIAAIFFISFGCCLIVLLFALIIHSIFSSETEKIPVEIFYVVVLFIGVGIPSLRARREAIKSSKSEFRIEENEFFDTYIIVKEYIDGEHISTAKIYYRQIKQVKKTKSYYLIFTTKMRILVVNKTTTPPEELDKILALIEEGTWNAKYGSGDDGQAETKERGEGNAPAPPTDGGEST